MANKQLYKLLKGNHSRMEGGRRVRYRAGDTFVPTDAELKAFGDKLEPVVEQKLVEGKQENKGEQKSKDNKK